MNQMLKEVNAGVAVNEENIPPPVLTKSSRNNSARDLSEQQQTPPEPKPSPASSTIPHNVIFSPEDQPGLNLTLNDASKTSSIDKVKRERECACVC